MVENELFKKMIAVSSSSPVRFAFIASLILSLIAALGAVTIGRDAVFYLDIARTFDEAGWQAAYERFNWPWYSVFLGVLYKVTHIPLVPLAYTINAFFLAGACALLVKLVRDRVPAAAWWACLVVLAVPAFNDYRDDIWREYGFWFFCILALYLTVIWSEHGGWLRAAAVYAAIFLAALFRMEALFLVAPICAWQVLSIRSRADLAKAIQIISIPVAGLLVGAGLLLLVLDEDNISRLTYYLSLLNPNGIIDSLNIFSNRVAESMEAKYSQDEAGEIVFFGIVGTILYGFFKSLGVFIIPYIAGKRKEEARPLHGVFSLFSLAFVFYFIVLLVYFLQSQFTTGRYSSFLAMLAVPFTALLCFNFSNRFPKMGKALIVLGLIGMLANVVSLSPGRTHYKEAAFWVKENVEQDARVYFMDGRIAFYAGRAVPNSIRPQQEAITRQVGSFDYFVITYSADDAEIKEFVRKETVNIVAVFINKDGKEVAIFSRK